MAVLKPSVAAHGIESMDIFSHPLSQTLLAFGLALWDVRDGERKQEMFLYLVTAGAETPGSWTHKPLPPDSVVQ